jgi:aminoglycoside 6'-N-acetyltransferase I
VRHVVAADAARWSELRTAFWPDTSDAHRAEIAEYFSTPPAHWVCLVAVTSDGHVVGIAEVGLRDYAERCKTSPVGYLEGIYVDPEARTAGVGRLLVTFGEAWARGQGCVEMASDRSIENDLSGAFHEALGFEEAHRLVCYRKDL